jgi:hypothetical protein
MRSLEERGVNCAGCAGTCCTFVANSMQVTPLEALDLYDELGGIDAELEARLRAAIANFALDRPAVGDGRRAFSRKRYTCPFFGHKALGCPLARAAKPYGCLAFNARSAGVKDGEDCGLEGEPVEAGEINARIRGALRLAWDKESIPVALLALRQALGAHGKTLS